MKKLSYLHFLSLSTLALLISQPVQQQIMHPNRIGQVASINEDLLDKSKALQQFAIEVKNATQENQKIPPKNPAYLRIATYNVHFWQNPTSTKNTEKEILDVINYLNPDVIVLQEVSESLPFENSEIMQALTEKTNFHFFSGCNTLPHIWFGNLIASKIPFLERERMTFKEQFKGAFEKRCFTFVQLPLPTLNSPIMLYGTHLEVGGSESLRRKQLEEIVTIIKNNPAKNSLIIGDFNATRSTETVQYLQQEGFKDCFSYLGWNHPSFTNWTGKEIDFIFLSPQWNLPLAGCYVYYSNASDHFPLIIDIPLTAETQDNLSSSLINISNDLNLIKSYL